MLIGLELERELYNGELSNLKNASLPIFAAIGGICLPALIHFSLHAGTPIGGRFYDVNFYNEPPRFPESRHSIFKNVPFDGEPRTYLQLRFELFNVFNHTQFSDEARL